MEKKRPKIHVTVCKYVEGSRVEDPMDGRVYPAPLQVDTLRESPGSSFWLASSSSAED